MEREEVEKTITAILRENPSAVIEIEEGGVLGSILGKIIGQYFETRGDYGIVIREFSGENEEDLKKKPLISFSSIIAIRHLSVWDLIDKINSAERPVKSVLRNLRAIGAVLRDE